MSSSAIGLGRAARFYDAPIGKKAVMAVTGVILFGFVLVHMLGNLQIFLPADASGIYAIDKYGEALRAVPELLWLARLVLLTAVGLHIISSIQLARMKLNARSVSYVKKDNIASSYASRTMYWSGPIVLVFIIYHLLHFTTGTVHPQFQSLHVHDNVVRGFQQIPVSLFYILAMVLLGMHLNHGIWSMFQSLGIAHPKYTPKFKLAAQLFSTLIVVGNCSIPVAVMLGLVK
jgi:succinate dehydrogenase / fumarate reductase cytochrome b subunit